MVESQSDYPEFLYRYRSFDTEYAFEEIERAVNNRQVYLSIAAKLNDPFDFCPKYIGSEPKEVLAELRKKYGSNSVLSKARASEITGRKFTRTEFRPIARKLKPSPQHALTEIKTYKGMISSLQGKAKLACFSESGESIPMWAHYTRNHTGFCVRYRLDLTDPMDLDQPAPLKVSYNVDRPTLNTIELMKFTTRAKVGRDEQKIQDTVFDAMFLHKSAEWMYENEWRVFIHDHEGPRYKRIDRLAVDSITFGIRAASRNIENVMNKFATRIKFRQAYASSSRFSLDYLDLN